MSLDERKKGASSEHNAHIPPLDEKTSEEKESEHNQKTEAATEKAYPVSQNTANDDVDDDDAPTTPGLLAVRRASKESTSSSTNGASASAQETPTPQVPISDEQPPLTKEDGTPESDASKVSASDEEPTPPNIEVSTTSVESADEVSAKVPEEAQEQPAAQEKVRVGEEEVQEEARKRTPNIVPARRPKGGNMLSTRQQRAVRALEKRQARDGATSKGDKQEKQSPAAQPPLQRETPPESSDIEKLPTTHLASAAPVEEAESKPAIAEEKPDAEAPADENVENLPTAQLTISAPAEEPKSKPSTDEEKVSAHKPSVIPSRPSGNGSHNGKKKPAWSGPPARPRSSETPVENRPTEQLPATEVAGNAESKPGVGLAQKEEVSLDFEKQTPPFDVVPKAEGSYPVVPLRKMTQGRKGRLALQHHRTVLRVTRLRNRHTFEHKKRIRGHLVLTAFSILMTLLIIFLALGGTGAYFGYQFYSDTQGRYSGRVLNLRDLLPKDNLKVYDSKGALLGQLADDGLHTSVKLDDVSPDLINATISVEDKNFWTNPGVDITRILQAALDNLKSGKVVEGGSTITQQLIKKLIVGDRVDNMRKLEEIILTPQVNSMYTKKDIMEMYLNTIYYGAQAYGIDAAANVYFGLQDKPGKPASKQLDLAQAAMLAGLPQNGDYYNPWVHRDRATQRMQTVLSLMVEQHYITTAQANDALKEAKGKNFFKPSPNLGLRAPHFFYFVLDQLQSMTHMSRQQLSRSDMKVTTTLNISLQDKIQRVMQDHVSELHEFNISNAAEVLINQHTGAIISLLGSLDYNDNSIGGKFDVATQGYRQPGSSFKPYVYALAFEEKGTSPAQAVNDVPTTFTIPGSEDFTPGNYDEKFHGPMTLRCALQNSLNIPAVRVLQQVGVENAVEKAKEMGIDYKGTPGLSLVLGGLSVHLLDHVSAFGSFGNNGVHIPYYAVEKIEYAQDGKVVKHQQSKGKQIFSSQTAYMITNTLSDNESRLPEFFDCNPLQLYSNSKDACYAGDRGAVRPAAAKTGTTNDFRDNWTLGYTTDYVLGVWAGNNDNSSMSSRATGVVGAAPIWHDAMLLAEEGRPIRDFSVPGGLVRTTATIDGIRSTDWFYTDKVPGGYGSNTDQSWDLQSLLQDPPQNNQNPPDKNKDKDKDKGKPKYTPYCPNFSYVSSNPGAGGW